MPIAVKIDVTKIDKSRLFQGKKGKYLNVLLVETPNSKYDKDYMVVHEQTREEREKREKSIILGNAKILERKGGNGGQQKGGEEDDW